MFYRDNTAARPDGGHRRGWNKNRGTGYILRGSQQVGLVRCLPGTLSSTRKK